MERDLLLRLVRGAAPRGARGIGGIAVETVTEDAHTSRACIAADGTPRTSNPAGRGLATESLSAHIGQRIRWARGMAQILRIDNPLFGRGLTIAQRLCYFNAAAHFLFALPRLDSFSRFHWSICSWAW